MQLHMVNKVMQLSAKLLFDPYQGTCHHPRQGYAPLPHLCLHILSSSPPSMPNYISEELRTTNYALLFVTHEEAKQRDDG